MLKLLQIIFLILISQFGTHAQELIKGVIVDKETSEKLIGAQILWVSDYSNAVVSDINGYFELSTESKQDSSKILVSYVGYKEQVVIYAKENLRFLQIELETKAVRTQIVVISAEKILSEEFATTKLNKLDIYTNPNSRADPLRAVNSLPFSSNSDETANISLRGSPPGETGIFFNGVPIQDAFRLDQANGVGQFSIFNTSIISKVSVHPSNPPLEFGAATSGMVSLQTNNNLAGRSRGVNLTMAGAGLNFSEKLGKKSSISSYLNWGNGYFLKKLNSDAFARLDGFNSFDAGIHLVHLFSPSARLKLFNYSLSESYDYQFTHPSHHGIFAQSKKRNLTIINFQKNWKNFVMNVNQGFNFSNGRYETGNICNNLLRKDFFTGVSSNFQLGKLSVKNGYALAVNIANTSGTYPLFFHALDNRHPSLSYVQNDKYVIPEAFLYIKYKLSDKISVAAARRSSVKTDGVPKFGSFQGNVNAQLNDRNRIQLAGGIYRRFQLQNAGVDLAQVVSSKQVSLDYLHERKKFKIQSALYAKETSYKSYINPIIGAELFFEYDYGPLKTSISLAHIQSEIETDEFRYPTPNNFDIFLRWIGKYEWVGVCAISAIYIHRNGIYYQPVINSTYHEQTDTYIPSYIGLEEGRMLADYQVLDLNLSKTFIVGEGSLISFVSASNTFNRKNQKSASYSSDYVQNGFNYFNQRVIFAGMVYNW